MKKIFSICFLSFFLIGLITSPGFSQTAKEILEKMIEAYGGREVLAKINDTTLSGSMEMIQMGLNGSLTMYQKEPNKMRMDFEIMGMMITQAYDGETAWMINPQTGNAEELPEKSAEDFKRQAIGNDAILHPEKYGITYSYKEKVKIEGKEYFVLEQTFSDGHKVIQYVDSETYLTYKSITTTFNQMGVEVEAETFLSDYKKLEGMMVPHSLTILYDGEEFIKMTITEVSFNSGLEDSLFKMSE